jgi:sec-independent protein translocase protein TatB
MFDFGYGELLIIAIAALIFIGPKELPGVLRALGQWTSKIRRMAGEFQNQFQEAMREAELADLKNEVDDMAAQASRYSNFDPISEVRKDLDNAQREVESALVDNKPAAEASGATSPSVEPASSTPTLGEGAAAAPAKTEPVREPVTHGTGGSEPA